ncbi:DUF126 domain-containing protein [Lachnospiraceae bacterium OttesenSCG-928-E19]|nr:DUF126 domain-containing protein [Lachnospiraceae bacterium OttesenSCG-928-E19]
MIEIKKFKTLLEGNPKAEALVSNKPLSFWGGVDTATGRIQDVHHDLCGEVLTGKILCIPYDRGSCSGSGILIEMVKRRTAPAAIICLEAEPVLALGPLIGEKMYGHGMALRNITEEDYEKFSTGDIVTFTDESILIEKR